MKTKVKLLTLGFILGPAILLAFLNTKALALESKPVVRTTGVQVVERTAFILGGSYSGATAGREFVYYFEYRENNPDLTAKAQPVTDIDSTKNTGNSILFYSSPNLLFRTTYYLRAVGHYKDNPGEKFYGNVLNFYTGDPGGGGTIGGNYMYQTPSGGSGFAYQTPYPTPPRGLEIPSAPGIPSGGSAPTPTPTAPDDSGDGLVPCGKTGQKECTLKDALTLINNVVKFVLFKMVVPIAAIMFFYAGILLITSQGGETKTKAKGIFTNAVIGLAIAIAAWLIITTLLSIIGYGGAGTYFKL